MQAQSKPRLGMGNKNSSYLSDEELDALDAEILAADGVPEPVTGLTDAVIRKGAALASTGATRPKIGTELGLTKYMVNKMFQHELFRSTLASISDDAVAEAKAKTRHDISKMQSKAMKALEKNLDKDSLEAVKIFLKSMGLAEEVENKDGGGFTLMLATQPKPQNTTTVVVKKEGEE